MLIPFDVMRMMRKPAETKMILLVLDGLGGMPMEPGGPTELEAAETPNLDHLAGEGTLGQIIPVRAGIAPGSGPAHLALFGYDPITYRAGRGVLEATGIGMTIFKGDVAARGNLCTLDENGNISDRRAGRISSQEAIPLIERLQQIDLGDVKVETRHVREYRFCVVMRGEDLEPDVEDTDPQETSVPPAEAIARNKASQRTADLYNQWIAKARQILSDQPKANGLTLRGFSTYPQLPQFDDIFGLRAACIAEYPMYRGVSRLVGMEIQELNGDKPEDEFGVVRDVWEDYDYFFVHIKKTDSRGEDGDFSAKAKVIEGVDRALPQLLDLQPDVIAVTGDHSTPSRIRRHSWHPVPLLLWAPATARPDLAQSFGERKCANGGFGTIPATDIMPLMMAHADRWEKFGA
jgi:2,3-bisphosphoglycerate-independent phosphoglycerate mutase